MLRTFGLSHIALAVRDLDRAFGFYHTLLGAEEVYRKPDFLQVQTPGSHDVIVFEPLPESAGKPGGIIHFGFRLQDPADIHAAAQKVIEGGGQIKEQGEFAPGIPFLFAIDPDGYEIEIWWEPPTHLEHSTAD